MDELKSVRRELRHCAEELAASRNYNVNLQNQLSLAYERHTELERQLSLYRDKFGPLIDDNDNDKRDRNDADQNQQKMQENDADKDENDIVDIISENIVESKIEKANGKNM
jgi:hypothetical protein